MIKTTYICDKCKQEMEKPEEGCIAIDGESFTLNIALFRLSDNSVPHICKYCIIDLIVSKLDDRPKNGYATVETLDGKNHAVRTR